MDLVFLDVDGVLNSALDRWNFDATAMRAFRRILHSSDNARVVVSSTWRLEPASMRVLEAALGSGVILSQTPDLGAQRPTYPVAHVHSTRTDEILTWLFANAAPSTGNSAAAGTGRAPLWTSRVEALRALGASTESDSESSGAAAEPGLGWQLSAGAPLRLRSFVVLDDLPLGEHGCFGPRLAPFLVRTDGAVGLTDEDANKAISTLSAARGEQTPSREPSAAPPPPPLQSWWDGTFKRCANPRCRVPADTADGGGVAGSPRAVSAPAAGSGASPQQPRQQSPEQQRQPQQQQPARSFWLKGGADSSSSSDGDGEGDGLGGW